ncbi:protein EXECUTER 1, chloroplastic [Salvia miltiorrhiza]|uniref:protein EXECUTER 1, chloroplastic n=1 Tax=Salvia miltiorrhiza TaxID=226208 RepID=UPI0025AD7B4B|nr:protein EXECUTER 1, chloroplastic [Salvia miltiorrhiza]XP_057787958.1 protein EXECUTER 1, chloroplastic [Salvia miltiorrhiza]
MASICPPTFPSPRTDPNPQKLNFVHSRFSSSKLGRRLQSGVSLSRVPDFSFSCRCSDKRSGGGDSSDSGAEDAWRWDFGIQETFRNAIKRFDDYLSSLRDQRADGTLVVAEKWGDEEEDGEEWDWERWRKHFVEVDEQERIVSILKSQLANAIEREDYEEAARIKVAIAAAARSDTVGRVMSHLKKSVEEERYGDAALIRDHAGAGLVGWWAGTSEDSNDPYGRIIHISAEYGRYIARSYSPRQLATSSVGAPVFEVYLRDNHGGDYKQQAVYLKRKGAPEDVYVPSFKSSGGSRSLDSRDARDNKSKLFERSSEDTEDGEDMDDDIGFDNILQDMIPGVKVKVVKVTAPEKVDRDIISKVIEQIIDEEDEEKDYEIESVDADNEIKSANEDEHSDTDLDSGSEIAEEDEQHQIALQVVVGDGFLQKLSRGAHARDLLRVPARLEKKGRMTFTFTVEEDANEHQPGGDGPSAKNKRSKLPGQRSIDNLMLDFVKSIGKGKIPMKVLQDVGELINLTLNQARNSQPLSGSTTFSRIDVSSSSDPLNGLYIGAHGLYTSEVIHMRRRFGQWNEDGSTKKPSKIEFYEYVEAVKLTGDAYVPAGQVAFRAKVGKKYQLPHKGIIPEEFGVIARYRGQGRLAEPGFQSPRWVDGELVILDGKYIKGGPVVGFVYWAPEYHFLVFFNRLRLLD